MRTSMRPTTAWTTTRATCTSLEQTLRARNLCHTLFILSHMHLLAQGLESRHCHPCSCAFLLESFLLFYFHLSFLVFFFSFHLLHCELHTELDNLIAMQNLRYSANKGSVNTHDVSVSLAGYEPNFMAFSELNDSSGSFSYNYPVIGPEHGWRDTRQAAHRGTPRTSRLLRTRRRVSQSVVVCRVR